MVNTIQLKLRDGNARWKNYLNEPIVYRCAIKSRTRLTTVLMGRFNKTIENFLPANLYATLPHWLKIENSNFDIKF